MSNSATAQEPSMEEILASIRKIISEDDAADGAAGAAAQPEAGEAANGAEAPDAAIGNQAADEDVHRRPTVRLDQAPEQVSAPVRSPAQISDPSEISDKVSDVPQHSNGHAEAQSTVTGFEGVPQPGDQPLHLTPAAGENDQDSALIEAPAPPSSARTAEPSAPSPAPAANDSGSDEPTLDLTEMVAEDGSVVKIQPQGIGQEPPAAAEVASEAEADPEPQEPEYQDEILDLDAPVVESAQPEPSTQNSAEEEDPSSFGTAFGLAARDGEDSVRTPDVGVESQFEDAGSSDHPAVSYQDADLDGSPAYLTATPPADDQAADEPQEPVEPLAPTRNEDPPLSPGDAFAELAGGADENPDPHSEFDAPPDFQEETASTESNDPHPAAETAWQDRDSDPDPEPEPAPTQIDQTEETEMTDQQTVGNAASLINGAGGSGDGLEAMVAKVAEPMVRDWIEQNLSRMIEDIVKEEVSRRLTGGS